MNPIFDITDDETDADRRRVYEQTGVQILDSLPSFMRKDVAFEPLNFVKAAPKEPSQ